MFERLKRRPPMEKVIVIEGNSWSEFAIEEHTEAYVKAGGYCWPTEAVQRFTRPEGGFARVINAPKELAVAAEKLNELMDSIILKNVFAYRVPDKMFSPMNIVTFVLLLVVLVAMFRK